MKRLLNPPLSGERTARGPVPDDMATPGVLGPGTSKYPGLGNAQPGGISQPSGGPPTRVISNPDQVPPPTAQYFNVQQVGIVAAGGGVRTLVASFQVPTNNVGVIGNLIVSAQGVLNTSRITFELHQAGGLIQGWNPILVPQAAAAVSQGYDGDFVRIKLNDGVLVQIFALVSDAGPYTVYAQALGYYYSKAERANWERGF